MSIAAVNAIARNLVNKRFMGSPFYLYPQFAGFSLRAAVTGSRLSCGDVDGGKRAGDCGCAAGSLVKAVTIGEQSLRASKPLSASLFSPLPFALYDI